LKKKAFNPKENQLNNLLKNYVCVTFPHEFIRRTSGIHPVTLLARAYHSEVSNLQQSHCLVIVKFTDNILSDQATLREKGKKSVAELRPCVKSSQQSDNKHCKGPSFALQANRQ
jgi:hypothetical protein